MMAMEEKTRNRKNLLLPDSMYLNTWSNDERGIYSIHTNAQNMEYCYAVDILDDNGLDVLSRKLILSYTNKCETPQSCEDSFCLLPYWKRRNLGM